MPDIDLDPRLIKLLEHRDFFEPDEPDLITVEADDLVLDVIILARVKRPADVGTGSSGLVIISDNQTDDLMVTGMLATAYRIDADNIREPRAPEDDS